MGYVATIRTAISQIIDISKMDVDLLEDNQAGGETVVAANFPVVAIQDMATAAMMMPNLRDRPHEVMNQPYDYFIAHDAFIAGNWTSTVRMMKRGDVVRLNDGTRLDVHATFDTADKLIQIVLCKIMTYNRRATRAP
jgi:hypothetical protein